MYRQISDAFPIQNGLKQGDALLALIFNFALQYAIRYAKYNQKVLELTETHQLMAYSDDNMVGEIINIIRNTESLLEANRQVDVSRSSEN